MAKTAIHVNPNQCRTLAGDVPETEIRNMDGPAYMFRDFNKSGGKAGE